MPNLGRRMFVAAAIACPALAHSRVWASTNLLGRVHPELRSTATRLLTNARGAAALSLSTLDIMRKGDADAAQPLLADVTVTEHRVVRNSNMSPVTVYVVNAILGVARPAILHIHGGGFVGGSAKGSRRQLQELAKALNCVIASVEYRLAPETDWHGSTEDNYAALLWLYENAVALGIDRTRIVTLGESAGGGHAALVAIRARDSGVVRLAGQALVYPMLDDRTTAAPFDDVFFSWTPASNRFGWRAFLGQEPGTSRVPSAAVPARVADLTGLPKTWIGVGSIDLFAKENVTFARRLRKAGVPTELRVTLGGFHGFDVLVPDAIVSRKFTAQKINALRRLLCAA